MLDTEDEYLLEVVGNYLQDNLNLKFVDLNADALKIGEYPLALQDSYYLWTLSCEVGGNGLEVYVLQAAGYEIMGSHKALQNIGDTKLLPLLEEAIAMAVIPDEDGYECADFMEEEIDHNWFKQFKSSGKYEEIDDIDDAENTAELASDYLRDISGRYIRKEINKLT